MIASFFHEALYRPLFNLLIGIYNVIPGNDFGIAIILMTILIRVIFVPLSIKSLRSQQAITNIQPKIKELNDKHKNDRQALAQATMALYKEHNVNPLSGCVPILIQLPVIWALYRVFRDGFVASNLGQLYSFVSRPSEIHTVSMGFLNLTVHNPLMAVMAGALQFVQAWLMTKLQKNAMAGVADSPALAMTRQMMYVFPIMIIFISWKLPAGLVLYWITTTAFSIFEQLYIRKRYVVR